MKFRILPEPLHPVALAAAKHFEDNWGVSKFDVEKPLPVDVDRCPTLQAVTTDQQILSIEVSEEPFPRGLESLVLDCTQKCIPMRLFVAVPADPQGTNFKADLSRARACGVGVLEVTDAGVTKHCEALSLSLTGLRPLNPVDFPKKYRMALSRAQDTYKNGDPVKGCSTIYDEIEGLSRRVAEKTRKKGMWRKLKPGEKPPKVDLDKGPWAKVMRTLLEHLDHKKCKSIPQPLLGSLLGLTAPRNEDAHKIKTVKALVQRDKRLRTRFENAVDLLSELIRASKGLGA